MAIRYSTSRVQIVQKYAELVSDKAFRNAGAGGDLGRGSRIFHGEQRWVWVGENRQAAAYYLGVIMCYVDGDVSALPDDVREIHDDLIHCTGRVGAEYQRGYDDARYKRDNPR